MPTTCPLRPASLLPSGRPNVRPIPPGKRPLLLRRETPKPSSLTPDPYGLDEYDQEDLDFIDDGPIVQEETPRDWRRALRGITGYNPSAFVGAEDDGEAAEASLNEQQFEERRSARIAAVEDAIELKRIQEEEDRARRRKRMKTA